MVVEVVVVVEVVEVVDVVVVVGGLAPRGRSVGPLGVVWLPLPPRAILSPLRASQRAASQGTTDSVEF